MPGGTGMSALTPRGTPHAVPKGNCASGSRAREARVAVREMFGRPPECVSLLPAYCWSRDSTREV
eukprot:8078467-Lingulodinium_polyedra.AAC.1